MGRIGETLGRLLRELAEYQPPQQTVEGVRPSTPRPSEVSDDELVSEKAGARWKRKAIGKQKELERLKVQYEALVEKATALREQLKIKRDRRDSAVASAIKTGLAEANEAAAQRYEAMVEAQNALATFNRAVRVTGCANLATLIAEWKRGKGIALNLVEIVLTCDSPGLLALGSAEGWPLLNGESEETYRERVATAFEQGLKGPLLDGAGRT